MVLHELHCTASPSDPEGQLLDDVYNRNGNAKYKYFYHGAEGGKGYLDCMCRRL